MKSLWMRFRVAVEEFLTFSSAPGTIYGIEDSIGRVFTVQAPALKLLEPEIPKEILVRFVSKNEHGEFSGFADGPVRRRVMRRDNGIIPLYYFLSEFALVIPRDRSWCDGISFSA